jgi:predicted amidohydrolase
VNRVGTDAKGNDYSGDSSVFGPLGDLIWQHTETEAVRTITLEKGNLSQIREKLPFLKDADKFMLL